jgi:hypothetical protein
LATIPTKGFSLSSFSFSVSTVSLFKYVFEHHLLLRSGEKFADPDDLLEPFVFADLQNDLLGARQFVGRESVMSVDNEPNIAVPSNQRGGRYLVYWTPRQPKGSRFVECVSREAQEANTYEG